MHDSESIMVYATWYPMQSKTGSEPPHYCIIIKHLIQISAKYLGKNIYIFKAEQELG